MRTTNMMRHLAWSVLGLVAQQAFPQATQPNNNGGPTSYLGWNLAASQILEVRNNANRRIEWFTDSQPRMRLSETLSGQTVNGYGGLDLSGYLYVGDAIGAAYPNHAAQVHVENLSSLSRGYRPVIGDGFLATQGEALWYGGLLGGSGASGIIWAKYTSAIGTPGEFKFIYTGDNTLATVASSTNGLELGRFQPDASLNEGYFGVGDFTSAGVVPNHRLHVLSGAVRIEELPLPAYQGSGLTKYLVVEDAIAGQIGRLKWQTLPPGLCDWNVTGANNDVVTAYSGNPCPPQNNANVGIGISTPQAKVDVVKDVNTNATLSLGVSLRMTTTSNTNIGYNSVVMGSAQIANYGGYFEAGNAGVVYGAKGTAGGSSTNYGLYGQATTSALYNVGVYGIAMNGTTS